MKKSEMIKLMSKCIKAHDCFVGCTPEYIGTALLSVLIDAGMLAPEVSPLPQHIIDDCLSGNYWEDEDAEE